MAEIFLKIYASSILISTNGALDEQSKREIVNMAAVFYIILIIVDPFQAYTLTFCSLSCT